jgi:predicted phosphodiesterase
VLRQGATVVLHLGDVYYAGFPEEFKRLSDKIKQLRTKVPSLRYYTVPGNHDFYTNGGPFYDSLNNYNDDPKLKQKFGFFCLRNKSNTVQYIGLDTGYSDSGTFNEIDPKYQGPFVYPEELAWAKEKILSFKGQTILLTHHQAFSPYEKIIGVLTSFGTTNQQINPKLCEQFFEFLPKVDVWYWGHEHKLNFFKPNAYGIPCARLLGNSSFQVHHPDTYNIKFPDYNPVIARYNPGKNDKQDPS